MFTTTDTIVAVATPAGRGGVGMVRLSGPDAHPIACRLLGRHVTLERQRATFGHVHDESGDRHQVVDQVVATWFQAPHSYTRQDVVEITAHGSPVLLERIVELSIAAGARLANPGEFTLRAYLSGRLDLIQAEAVRDVVDAVTPLQARAAMDQLEGTLTGKVRGIEAALFDLAARLEASLDFPDEGFHFITRDQAQAELRTARDALSQLSSAGRAGRLLREGSMVVIAGRPNAGKSSLFNALAGAARAIVTDVPGTTRDVLTDRVDLNGIPITFVDTAGLREATDEIEAEGVRRAMEARDVAALTLLVVDRSSPGAGHDIQALGTRGQPVLVVLNKCDLPRAIESGRLDSSLPVVEVSATTGDGLQVLRDRIVQILTGRDEWRDPPAMSNIRHLTQVEHALAALARAERALAEGATEELVLAELVETREALEEITGRKTSEDLLRHIFGRFCIGK